jgi:hypothetical protein
MDESFDGLDARRIRLKGTERMLPNGSDDVLFVASARFESKR